MGRRRRCPSRAKAAAKPSEDSPPDAEPSEDSPPDTDPTSLSSFPSGPSTESAASQHKPPLAGLQPHQDDDDEAWTQSDKRAMRRRLLDMIHRFYLDAISRLPPAEFRRTTGLSRGLFVGGHCFGLLHPVHNIVVNCIWYAAAFPVRRPAGSEDEDEANALLSTDGIARICHRSLDGLVAALRDLCPSLSNGAALWRLFSSGADLTAAVALADGVSKSSALRVVASQGHAAFHLAALVAQHPDPTAFAHFASSALPSINGQHNIVQLLIMKRVLASRHINYLSKVLVPSSPHEPPVSPLMLSAQVLDCIASQKQQSKGIGKQLVNIVNMALQEYTQRSGEHLKLHSVCGASLLKEEGLENCYHINFLAYQEGSGSAIGDPVLFFTEAVAVSCDCDETDIRLCVPVDWLLLCLREKQEEGCAPLLS